MFVGLDVHKKYTEVAVLDEDGAVRKQERIQNKPELIEEFSNNFSADMVTESSSTWYWLYEILSRRHRVVLSHPDVLTVKDRIDVESSEHLRVIYKGLRAMSESLNGRVKARLAFSRLTWQGIQNVSVHVSLVLCVVFAVAIAAAVIGKPELRYSIACFA
jgi:hypothetical protein